MRVIFRSNTSPIATTTKSAPIPGFTRPLRAFPTWWPRADQEFGARPRAPPPKLEGRTRHLEGHADDRFNVYRRAVFSARSKPPLQQRLAGIFIQPFIKALKHADLAHAT